MPNPQGSFVWYELITPDPDGAKRFYDAVVGWDIGQPPPGDMDYRMIGRSDGKHAGGVLRLDQAMQRQGARPCWMGYIGVDDVDRSIAAVQADGGRVLAEPHDIPGVGRWAMIADPQGAPSYLMRPEPPADQPDAVSNVFSVEQPQHVRWNELATSDPDAAIAFYTRHFGWRQDGAMDMGEMGKYQFFYQGDTMIGAVMPKLPQMPASAWTFYIGVDDIDRAHEAVRSGGGQVLQEPIQIPGGDYSLTAVDPQGAAFGLVGARNA